jgi:hypothetical protein
MAKDMYMIYLGLIVLLFPFTHALYAGTNNTFDFIGCYDKYQVAIHEPNFNSSQYLLKSCTLDTKLQIWNCKCDSVLNRLEITPNETMEGHMVDVIIQYYLSNKPFDKRIENHLNLKIVRKPYVFVPFWNTGTDKSDNSLVWLMLFALVVLFALFAFVVRYVKHTFVDDKTPEQIDKETEKLQRKYQK